MGIDLSSFVYGARFAKHVKIGSRCDVQRSEFGDFSYCGDGCYLPQTRVGKYCSIARGVQLAAGNHPKDYLSTHPATYSKDAYPKTGFCSNNSFTEEFSYVDDDKKILCEIGNDVWIATNALLVCGSEPLRVGDGCIVAAGAVVTRSTPPYSIVAGVPAKVIGWRFDEQTIAMLLELRWWDKDDAWIRSNIELFATPHKLLD